MTRIATLLFILLLGLTANAQESAPAYGKPEDLQGLKKVFVDTGGDLKNRERIHKEIESAKLGLELLDSEAGAEIVISFGAGKTARMAGSVTNGTGSMKTKTYNTGDAQVYVIREGRPRIVMSYEGEETHLWEKKPATSFGRKFVQTYKKANGLK